MSTQEILQGLSVIASLVVIEGLLSVDNVLGIAALANQLPEKKQKTAIRLGLAGAYLFRVLALVVAEFLAANLWVRWLGAGYLVWLMCSHLTRHDPETESGKGKLVAATMAGVLLQIGLMDLSLSIDNVIAAVSLAPKYPDGSLIMWPIYVGVLIAILALQAIAPHAMKLLKKYPVLEPTAFILIGLVGGILIYEEAYGLITHRMVHIPPYFKFGMILVVIMLALFYGADGAVRRVLHPFIRLAHPPMRWFAALVAGVFFPLVWVVRKVMKCRGGSGRILRGWGGMDPNKKQFLVLPFAVVAAFFASAACGQVVVEYFTLWREPFVGSLCAISVIIVVFLLAPTRKKISGAVVLFLGILAAWWLLRDSTYPEGCLHAYQPTIIPLVATVVAGSLSYLFCCLFCNRRRE